MTKKRFVVLLLACVMAMGLTVTAFAATPSVAKFTKENGNNLMFNMGTNVIQSCDLTDGVATVTTKPYTLLFYKGTIVNISGYAVESWTMPMARIDMTYDDGSGLAGVPVSLTFSFTNNLTPPGMSTNMNARFVCE